jgi:hypothetical protein
VTAPSIASRPTAWWARLDPRQITAPYPVLPLLVLMGLATTAQVGGLALLLLLPGIKDTFGASLFVVSTVVVIGIQLGLAADVPTAALANRLGAMRVLCGGMIVLASLLLTTAVAGLAANSVALDIGVAGVAVGGWALTSVQNRLLAAYYPESLRPTVFFALRAAIVGGLALAPLLIGALELFYDWQAPLEVLAGIMLAFVLAALLLPGPGRRATPAEPADADADDQADKKVVAAASATLTVTAPVLTDETTAEPEGEPDMASDLPNRPKNEGEAVKPVAAGDRVKPAGEKTDPRFEAARLKSEKEAEVRAAKEQAAQTAPDATDEVDEVDEAADTDESEAKPAGGFSFNRPAPDEADQ